jgi:fused signal recognition particle receptor
MLFFRKKKEEPPAQSDNLQGGAADALTPSAEATPAAGTQSAPFPAVEPLQETPDAIPAVPEAAPDAMPTAQEAARDTTVAPTSQPEPDAATVAPESAGEPATTTDGGLDAPPTENVATESTAPAEPAEEEESPSRGGFFGRLKSALSQRIRKTREEIVGQIRAAVKAAGKVDEHLLERIEEILIKADVGAETTFRIVEGMREFEARGATADELVANFKQQLLDIVGTQPTRLAPPSERPWVILFVGVNGTGKTTTIGKLAAELRARGLRTMLVAGDTFRAAAIEQLGIWAQRTGSDFVAKQMGADPAGVVYDAITKAQAENTDVVLIDTAGRLHTKTNLMEELKKIVRVTKKLMPNAPHDTLLVLDATTGQNAIQQAKAFTEAIPVTGLVMTKLDGTAKGGVLIGIRNLFQVPVVKIGVGEGIDDLRDFDPREFVDALFAEDESGN